MTPQRGTQGDPERGPGTALAATLALAVLAGCLGFGSAGSLPAGSIQITSDANATHEVTVTVTKIANDSDAIHQSNDSELAELAAKGSGVWNRTVTLGSDGTWTERGAIDEPGAYRVAAESANAVALQEGEATNGSIVDRTGSGTAWLGLYPAGRDGEQVAESTVWIHVGEDGDVTVSTLTDD